MTHLVAQMVKHLSAMRETWVQSLCWEDSLEKEMATQSSTLAQKIPWTEEPGVHGVTNSQTRQSNFTGKTIRPFRYDLNQIPYDYTVEVRNRFKGLDLTDRVPDEL